MIFEQEENGESGSGIAGDEIRISKSRGGMRNRNDSMQSRGSMQSPTPHSYLFTIVVAYGLT